MGYRDGKERGDIATEFNSNARRLYSFNDLLDECNHYSKLCTMNGYNIEYLKLWNKTLICVFKEILPKMKPEEEKNISDIYKQRKLIGRLIEVKPTPDGHINVINTKNFKMYAKLLNVVEGRLRKVADKKGMLMTVKDTNLDVIGEM